MTLEISELALNLATVVCITWVMWAQELHGQLNQVEALSSSCRLFQGLVPPNLEHSTA